MSYPTYQAAGCAQPTFVTCYILSDFCASAVNRNSKA